MLVIFDSHNFVEFTLTSDMLAR